MAVDLRARIAAGAVGIAVISALAFGPAAWAKIKGMPSLDATQPLGTPTPNQGAADAGATTPPKFTEDQVERGLRAYMGNCVDCHGSTLNNGEFGGAPLVGSYFRDRWGELTVDALFGYLSSAMPPDRPGRLNSQTYADLTAFLLDRNGYPSGNEELPPDIDAQATMSLAR
jgi:mono/diheme cytochrome c family protein